MSRIKDRQKLSALGMSYGIQRMDLLIVSISGAGIYICLETLKYINDKQLETSNLIKWSGGVLLLAIIVNFISQFLGHRSNLNDYLMCEAKLDAGNKANKSEQATIDRYDFKADCYDKATNIFNYASALSMICGLILLLTYFLMAF